MDLLTLLAFLSQDGRSFKRRQVPGANPERFLRPYPVLTAGSDNRSSYGSPRKTTTTGTTTKTKRLITGHAQAATRIRFVEVTVNYLQDGEPGAVSVIGDDYETARDQAFDLVPEDAERLSIMVDREQ